MKTGKIQKNTSLSTRALLVSVNISQWAGRKRDERATETANTAHKADASAGGYTKKLLPMAKELEVVATIASQARKFYYEQTLPWMSDGTRIISGLNYINFQSEMRKIKTTFEKAVKELETAYPRLVNEAKSKLGDLFSSGEYPDDIGAKFDIEVAFFPMPDSKDFRVAISETEKKIFEKKLRQIETEAMREATNRIYSVIKEAADKLKDPKAIFRDSLLENIRDMAALLPALNISNSPELDKLGAEAADLIDSFDMKNIRKDSKQRAGAQKKLKDIEGRMGAFMGGLK